MRIKWHLTTVVHIRGNKCINSQLSLEWKDAIMYMEKATITILSCMERTGRDFLNQVHCSPLSWLFLFLISCLHAWETGSRCVEWWHIQEGAWRTTTWTETFSHIYISVIYFRGFSAAGRHGDLTVMSEWLNKFKLKTYSISHIIILHWYVGTLYVETMYIERHCV